MSITREVGTKVVISFDLSFCSENISYQAKAGQILGTLPNNVNLLTDSI